MNSEVLKIIIFSDVSWKVVFRWQFSGSLNFSYRILLATAYTPADPPKFQVRFYSLDPGNESRNIESDHFPTTHEKYFPDNNFREAKTVHIEFSLLPRTDQQTCHILKINSIASILNSGMLRKSNFSFLMKKIFHMPTFRCSYELNSEALQS